MRSAKYIKRCPGFTNEKFLKYLPKVLQRSSFSKILFGRHLSNGVPESVLSCATKYPTFRLGPLLFEPDIGVRNLLYVLSNCLPTSWVLI